MEKYKQHRMNIGNESLAKGRSSFYDPAFANNKQAPIHRWVPWIAGFSSSFVRDTIERHANGHSTILDSFAGVGTTLVETVLLGHKPIGFEINPYAAMACRIKLQAGSSNPQMIANELERFLRFYSEHVNTSSIPNSIPPDGFRTRTPFYSPSVLHKVLLVQDFIKTIEDSYVRELFRLAFAATMVSFSNYSYEPSLTRRVTAGKPDIVDFSVEEAMHVKLREMIDDIIWFKAHIPKGAPVASIFNQSWFQYQDYLALDSIDMVITSPPYLNNYHYNRNTRPHLYWLGFAQSPKDFRRLEEANFGTFWQTAREQASIDLEFDLPHSDLSERLLYLRQLNPERGIYGGSGWANYAAAYFNDCYRFTRSLHQVMKRGGKAFIVIGNSILQGVHIPTDQYLGQIAESTGLEVTGIDIPRTTRVGSSIIRSNVRVGKARETQQLYEAVIELRKL